MGKYLLLWEFDRTKIPVDPKERGIEFNMLMKVIKQDIKKACSRIGDYWLAKITDIQSFRGLK
jgi:hypothetical protein